MDETDAWIRMNGWLFRKKKNTCGLIDSSNRMYVWIYAQSIRGCSVRHVHNSVYTNESLTVQYHPNIFIFHVKTTSILFISSFQLPLFAVNQICLCKIYIRVIRRRRNFSLSLVAKRRGRRKTEACVVSYRKTVEGNRKKERGGEEPRVTVIFREELNRQILLTNGNMTRAYRQGEPVHWRLVVRSLMITGDLLIFVVIFSPSSSVFLILDGLRNAHALVK